MDGVAQRLLEPDNLIKFNPDGSMTCPAGQVAHLLGLSETTFLRRLRAGEFGPTFPGKLPGTNKWSRPAVVAWISGNGNPAPAGTIRLGDPEIEAAISELEEEYGKGQAA